MYRHRIVYVLLLAICVGLAVTYLERRQLRERHEAFQQTEREIEEAKRQIGELEAALAEEEARARNMVTDPVEVEAAVRRIKRGVRDGETVFRVHAEAAPAETPAPEAAEARN